MSHPYRTELKGNDQHEHSIEKHLRNYLQCILIQQGVKPERARNWVTDNRGDFRLLTQHFIASREPAWDAP